MNAKPNVAFAKHFQEQELYKHFYQVNFEAAVLESLSAKRDYLQLMLSENILNTPYSYFFHFLINILNHAFIQKSAVNIFITLFLTV
jgi:hypothetical protein